ncbi:MAG: CheR family methyltransferase, partial [Salinibacter sp.]
QEPSDAEHQEMPHNAMSAGVIDLVRPADELAERLVAYHRNAHTIQLPESEEALPPDEQTTLQKMFAELRSRTGHDFSHYKRSTVLRRLERRLQVTDTETLDAYLQVLRDRPGEAHALYKELLISVTRFFRTPEDFETLADTVIPSLFADKEPDEEVRVWVAGCATGEEAYSVAMLLHEYAHTLEVSPELQVFATDVDPEGLDIARRGVYPATIEADVPDDRLDRFFLREDNQYRVSPSLRNTVVFAEHNLIEDPPFSNLDLVCCRNLLIYLDQTMQEYVFRLFHYALDEDGVLFLGPSEAVGPAQSLFSVVDETRSILKVKSPPADEERPMPLFPPSDTAPAPTSQPTTSTPPAQDVTGVHQRLLMQQTASLVVDENHDIVHLTERAGQFLEHEAGEPTHSLLEKVPPVLRLELRGALYQAFQKEAASERIVSLPLQADEAPKPVHVQVQPIDDPDLDRSLAQVRFEPVEERTSDVTEVEDVPPRESGEPTERERDLEEELQDVKEQLQIKAEEYETVTEEMETANEELMSMNEELQAKNEELQTSKEQLQSVNEELTTTNQQLNAKVEALDRANSDLQNLMEATEVATLFLDRDLEIRRYTPPITDIFRLRDSDVGRPITDFTPKIEYEGLINDARRVLDEQVSVEHEVEGDDGTWYLMRLRPYRSMADDVEGVVMTFVDITAQKRVAQELREERDLISALIDTAGALIVVLNAEGLIVRFNTACERLTGYDASEAEDLRELIVSPDDREAVTGHLDALAEGRTDRADFEMHWETTAGDRRLVKGSLTALREADGRVQRFIVTGTDMTRHRELEREIVEISDRERQRIGEDLHDVVGGDLTAAMMRTENLARKLEKEGISVDVEDLTHISEKIEEAGDRARAISHALVPKALRQDHLAAALAELAEEEEEFSAVTCEFVGDADEMRPDDDTDAMNLYRIAHEAVANAREHADPDRITIELTEEEADLVLCVRDDGGGWEGDSPDEEGLGLHLMRYRANLIGATLTLASDDGETVVECRLPL